VPARKKPASERQDNRPQRSKAKLAVVPAKPEPKVEAEAPALTQLDGSPIPEMPPGRWRKPTQQVWISFWSTSEIAPVMTEADHFVLYRYIVAVDEYHHAMTGVRKERTVNGSMGQIVLNPLTTWAKTQSDEMRKLEEELGIGLKKRAALGIEVGNAKLTARELNRMTEEADDDDTVEIIDASSEEEAELLEDFK
jgi:P27 family predicted phage terminase small subunit